MEQDGLNVKSELPVKFDPDQADKLVLNVPSKLKKRHKQATNEALMFAKYGLKVMRIKAATLAALGKSVEDAGVRSIGHGKVMVTSEASETAISKLMDMIDEAQSSNSTDKHEKILELMRLLKEFNGQLLQTAQLFLDSDKPLVSGPMKGAGVTMAFPAGQPLLVAPMPSKPQT